MDFGYAGKILHLNLTTQKWMGKSLDMDITKEFLEGN